MSRIFVLQHLDREGPGLFSKVAGERGIDLSISRLDQGDILPRPVKGDLLLVMGGPMGLRDLNSSNYPWLLKEVELIKDALKNDVGIIGVCLGAQLLSHAAGGDTEPLVAGIPPRACPEIGWQKIILTSQRKNQSFNSFLKSSMHVLHWHGDRILLPDKAELIAYSERCKEQFFSIGPMAYGLQFHIEIDEDMVRRWIAEDCDFIKSALGDYAQEILLKQQKRYGTKTQETRLKLINKLFDLLLLSH